MAYEWKVIVYRDKSGETKRTQIMVDTESQQYHDLFVAPRKKLYEKTMAHEPSKECLALQALDDGEATEEKIKELEALGFKFSSDYLDKLKK